MQRISFTQMRPETRSYWLTPKLHKCEHFNYKFNSVWCTPFPTFEDRAHEVPADARENLLDLDALNMIDAEARDTLVFLESVLNESLHVDPQLCMWFEQLKSS